MYKDKKSKTIIVVKELKENMVSIHLRRGIVENLKILIWEESALSPLTP